MKPTIKFGVIGLLHFLLAVGLAGCASSNNENLIGRQLALSDTQKLQFDRVFFNEIWLWNQVSWRYGERSGQKRQKEFEAMSEQGYLPAYVALKMFDFEKQIKEADASAFSLLRQAADAGDVSSACALIPIWAWNSIDGYPRDYGWSRSYVEIGTRAGHFACQEQMALLYRQGVIKPEIPQQEHQMLLRSAQGGYTHSFVILSNRLREPSEFYGRNLDPFMCWNAAYYLYTPWAAIHWDYYKAAAKGAYPQLGLTDQQRADTARLVEKWQGKMKSARAIMDIVNECLLLEEGGY